MKRTKKKKKKVKEKEKAALPMAVIATPVTGQLSAAERIAAGKAIRDIVPRSAHGPWKRDKARVDPIAILRASDEGRIEKLVPIRYGRMLATPFTFYRGAAAVMAADLAATPATGVRVQACGDCHLLNFGGFATPERRIVFDINDFDETLPAPWEWDVKRLVASFVLAARNNGMSEADAREAAVTCAWSYRKRMSEFAEMDPLEVWYLRMESDDMLALMPDKVTRKRISDRIETAKRRTSDIEYPELAEMTQGHIRIKNAPPLIFHPDDMGADEFQAGLASTLKSYRESLTDDRRALLDRYGLVDGAVKVVGIGSVGTMCLVILMMSASNQPLFLQWKEARQSVLEPYAGASAYSHHGQRVVMGQRLMQPASDVFLGWLTGSGKARRHGYVRQLRDAKIRPLVETMDAELLLIFAKACGWVLARAHAKAGDALTISGYLGSQANFDEAMGDFAIAYADQTERDHAALKAAVRAGKIQVQMES
jgi:uncharacterized protein (DUF2252 family)